MKLAKTFLLFWVASSVSILAQATTQPDARKPLQVGFLLLEGVYNSELMAPYDVFQHTIFHVNPGMQVFTVGRTKKPVRSFEGLVITPDHDLDSAPPIDVLVVPSSRHNMDSDLDDRRLMSWLATRGRRAKYVLSVCDGAFLLAEAGLLAGRTCTTFPGDIAAFKKHYPKLDVVEKVSFVADGPAITGAGGARSYDPAMYLVELLYGAPVARGIGRGLVIDWNLEKVSHVLARKTASRPARSSSWLPGEHIDASVTIEDANGALVTLAEIVKKQPDTRGVALVILAGAEGGDVKKRGGLWCEDSFNDLPLMRHLILDYAPKGILFVAVTCPPVYHEERFGFTKGVFLTRAATDPVFERDRRKFVERTLALQKNDVMPFKHVYFDIRFRLLANPKHGVPDQKLGPVPSWQGRFKWHGDTQMYGTPTVWVLKPDLEVFGQPFFMNVYESEGRHLNYNSHDVGGRLDRLLTLKWP